MTNDIQLKLAEHLQTIRNNHSSFMLMNAFDPALFPNGVVLLSNELTGNCKGKEYKFHDIVQELWRTSKSKVLFIKGDGGTGKTVSLLTFATEGGICNENIPAVYIPMYELNKYCDKSNDCITEYLINNYKYCDYFNDLNNLAVTKWKGKPSFILLLDGLNEIYNSCTKEIKNSIEEWAGKPGVFIVCTSRYLDQEIKNPVVFTLNHLNRKIAYDYLQQTIGANDIPALNDPVYSILDTPLMLNLYVQTEKYKEMYRASFYYWHVSKTEADIIWNYFQKELVRCREIQMKNTSEISLTECAMLLLWIAPYICYKMEQQNMFEIPEDELQRYINEAYEAYLSLDRLSIPSQIQATENELRKYVIFIKPCDSGYEQKLLDYLYYLADNMAIFCRKPNTNKYTLMHQNFRDCMTAMFLKNVIVKGVKENKVPVELKTSISEYVKNYLADLENEDEMLKLWELIRKENIAISDLNSYLPENEITLVHNFLRIYGKMTENDFSCLTFAEMDLRGINLFSYRKENSTLLKLASHDSTAFKKTNLSLENFKPQGHSDKVKCVAFSPDGRIIVSGSDDATIRIWDAETHQPIGSPMEGHIFGVNSVSFSPDGQRIVSSGSLDGTVKIWDVETHLLISSLSGDIVNSVSYSPDGKRIISGSYDSTIRIWDAETYQPIDSPMEGHTGIVTSVSYSPDGKRIVSGSRDRTIRIWDAETHRQISSPMEGHTDWVTSVSYSPNGKKIVSGSRDGTIIFWDPETLQPIGSPLIGHKSEVTSVAYSPDGQRIISGSMNAIIRIWDAVTHQQIGTTLKGHKSSVTSVAYSPDGGRIVSGSDDGTIRIWNAETLQPIGSPLTGHKSEVTSVAYSPDGRRIVSGLSDGIIRIWNATTYQQIATSLEGHSCKVNTVAYSPNGQKIVSGASDSTIRIWDAGTHSQIGSPLGGHINGVFFAAFSPYGQKIVGGGLVDNTVRIWDAETYQQIDPPLKGHTYTVTTVAYSPDGKRIVSGSDDETIRIWDAETHEQMGSPLEGHKDTVKSVSFSPDGKRIISGSNDQTIRIWDAETHQQIGTTLVGHKSPVISVAYSPDGRRIVSGSRGYTIRIWDAETHEQIGSTLEDHKDIVNSVSFSPDGKRIVSGSSDGTIRIWDAESHKCNKVIRPLSGIDISGLDFSKAILSDQDREVFCQNGVNVRKPDKQF